MGILDKAKELSGKVVDTVADFSSDELIADTVMRAVEKQEKVNRILQERGSNYRVGEMELEMGVPPTMSFAIRRISDHIKDDREDQGQSDGLA